MLTLFHDYTSPSSAVAVARAQRLAAQGLPIETVGFEAVGVDLRLPVPEDTAAEVERVADEARAEGVRLQPPPWLAPTALAHVVADVAADQGRLHAWDAAVYRAVWTHGAAIDEPSLLAELAETVGLDRDEVAQALDDRVRLAAVRRRAGEHRREGVGGVPTLLSQRTLVPGLLPEEDLRALAALD